MALLKASARVLWQMPHLDFTADRPFAVMDTECYPNYWCIGFFEPATGRRIRLRKYNESPLDIPRMVKILRNFRVGSFNGEGYDMTMIDLAARGWSNSQLKEASDLIIQGRMKPWEQRDYFGVDLPKWLDHIDVKEVSPGSPQMPSLKMYAGRLHSKRMKDLPFEIDTVLDDEQVEVLEDYHDNDMDVTADLAKELMPQIRLRAIMSQEFGIDVRSKSDAQVAEAVIVKEIERITGQRVYKPDWKAHKFRYTAPPYIKFKTEQMRDVLHKIQTESFVCDHAGTVHGPEFLKGLKITIGTTVFTMGIGGLHSNEKGLSIASSDTHVLLDRDVTSYYPAIILLQKLFPGHIGRVFLDVYLKIFQRRLEAKAKSKDKSLTEDQRRYWADVAETLKIVLNGSFGKFGSKYSKLFSPNLMIQTTITGQLSILMLIEDLYLRGMQCVSANTDGFVTYVPRDRIHEFHAVIFDWECDTGLGTEETEYAKLFSQGVNAYLGFEKDGKPKRKGKNFTQPGPGLKGASGMKKNPYAEICADAVIAYLWNGKPIADTVNDCYDIRKFLAVQKVAGGAYKDGEKIGKVIRWYWSTDTDTAIHDDEGGRVPRSQGAMPCMDLPDEFPDDIDHAWYVRESMAILEDFGINVRDPAFIGRTGMIIGRKESQKTYHYVNLEDGIGLCGQKRDSIREEWVEAEREPEGRAMCSKCKKLKFTDLI